MTAVAFVDVSAVEGYTLRPAACRMNRPDLIEQRPAAVVFVSLLVLSLPVVCHVVVLCDPAQCDEFWGEYTP